MSKPRKHCPYQVSTSYTLWFPRYCPTRFYMSRSLEQGQRLNQGHTMTLHIYTHQLVYLPSINFLHLMVYLWRYSPANFSRHPNAHPDTMGENNTRTDLKGCGVTTIFDLLINMHKRILGIYEYDISIAIN